VFSKIANTAFYVLIILLVVAVVVFAFLSVQREQHLKPIDKELIQQYKGIVSELQLEIDCLNAKNRQLQQENFDLSKQLSDVTDGYLDRFLELLETDKIKTRGR